MKKQFSVTGMSCASCSAHVERAVRELDGVSDVSVNLLSNSMTVQYDENITDDGKIISSVIHAGYGAALLESLNKKDKEKLSQKYSDEFKRNLRKLIISIVLLVVLMYFGMGNMLGLKLGRFDVSVNPALNATVQMILAAVIIGINFTFYRSGFTKLIRLAPNMDSLVAMGSAISFIYSVYRLINIFILSESDLSSAVATAHNLYFESAAMILVFISIGKTLESRSKVRTRDSIEELIKLKPETATRIIDGVESVVLIEDIAINDILVVRSGQLIPADGVIISGTASIDESVLTGESIPTDRSSGDSVYQATMNRSGYFEMRVTKSDSESALSEIIRIVEETAASKAPVSRLADRISAVFVPIVLGLAALVYIIWRIIGAEAYEALNYAISVIVISCPCSLGLATPTAITVGTGKAAGLGILFKSAAVMENLHDVDTVVLDKTGTVTTGNLTCPEECIIPADGIEKSQLLSFAALLEKSSQHPIGSCIYDYCLKHGADISLEASDYEELAGSGVTCMHDSKMLICGNREYVSKCCIVDDDSYNKVTDRGATPILFAAGDTFLGIIGVEDRIKPDSKEAVKGMMELNTDVFMLTGDIERTAASIAEKVGIINYSSGFKPQDKDIFIDELQNKGHKVAMIGDGINDAPALTKADVGIAIGTGTDIAIDSADVILTHGNLVDSVNAIDLSRKVMQNIRQNLFWAFFYNCLGIPVAAGVFTGLGVTLNPMISAALMSCSSLFVVSNALRLNLYKPKSEKNDIRELPYEPVNDNVISEGISVENTKEDAIMKFKIEIKGMMCIHCQNHVQKALTGLDGITADVNWETGIAMVESTREVTFEELINAIKEEGYEILSICRLS